MAQDLIWLAAVKLTEADRLEPRIGGAVGDQATAVSYRVLAYVRPGEQREDDIIILLNWHPERSAQRCRSEP